MVAIPVWLTGRHTASVVLTPQTNTGGTLTDTTPVATLTGHLDEINVRSTKDVEEISPLDTVRRNMVPIKVGTMIDCTEILKYSGTNFLATAFYGTAEYFKVAITRGAQSFTFYGLYVDYGEGLRRGKSVGTGSFEMVDPGAANPTYS